MPDIESLSRRDMREISRLQKTQLQDGGGVDERYLQGKNPMDKKLMKKLLVLDRQNKYMLGRTVSLTSKAELAQIHTPQGGFEERKKELVVIGHAADPRPLPGYTFVCGLTYIRRHIKKTTHESAEFAFARILTERISHYRQDVHDLHTPHPTPDNVWRLPPQESTFVPRYINYAHNEPETLIGITGNYDLLRGGDLHYKVKDLRSNVVRSSRSLDIVEQAIKNLPAANAGLLSLHRQTITAS